MMAIADMEKETIQKVAAPREALQIFIAPNGSLIVNSQVSGKSMTIELLLTAVKIVAMQDERKSPIIQPTAGQVVAVQH